MSVEADTLDARCEEFFKFPGEWLLIMGEQLLAHSREFRDIQAVIKDRQLKHCFLHYVPLPSEQDFVLL